MMSKKSPQLRFEGFTDDWEEHKLGDYIIQYSEKTKQNNQYPVFTSSRNGLFFQKDYYKGNQIASEDNIGYNIVPRGYFTYRHMSDDLVFKFNINDLADYGIVSTLYPVFTTNEQLNSKYLQYQLNEGSEFRRFSLLQKQGGSRTYMYLNKLQNMILNIPKLEEQQKIGSFFQQLDETIALHQRKLDLLKEQKKGYLQKMFPKNGSKIPELRFAGFADDWEERKLGELGSVAMNRRIFKDQTSENEEVPFFKIGTFGSKPDAFISRELFEEYKLKYPYPEIGDILISASGSIGRTVVYQGEDEYFQDSNIVWLKHDNRLDNKFLKQFYSIVKWQGLEGSTIKRLYNKNILDTDISIPSTIEQNKIGMFFEQLDDTITLHQRKLDLLKEQKKGFLQKMFV